MNQASWCEVKAKIGIVWFVVKEATDIQQPADNGYGALYKILINQIPDEWLESNKNIDLWLGNLEQTYRIRSKNFDYTLE